MTNATTTGMDQTTSLYDMTNLERMKDLGTHAPEAMKAFVAFDRAAEQTPRRSGSRRHRTCPPQTAALRHRRL